MNDLNKFLKGIPRGLWTVILVFIIIVCALPAILTLPGLLDFSDTGEIGDTIGGIMGPFIAILAALLTFIAFWAQFEANRELIKENRRNHFENRFYKMLDIHLESVAELNKRKEDEKIDSIFHVWCLEIENLFNFIKTQSDFGGYIDEIKTKYKNDPDQKDFRDFLVSMQSSHEVLEQVVFETVYSLFFNGSTSMLRYGDSHQTFLANQYASIITTLILSKGGDGAELLKIQPKNELLGRYYRHLFQIVKFVVEQPDDLFDEKNWKSGYLSVLRFQMSNYEQMLLYYNAQSSIGGAWNEKHYIEDYKLIKNIPYFNIALCAGTAPNVMYEEAIKKAEEKGEKFFERY